MRLRLQAAAAVVLAAATAAPAQVVTRTFNVSANGAKEVNAAGMPNQGDLDGTAIGTIVVTSNAPTGTTGTATFNVTLANLDFPLTGHHFHQAPSTTTGPIVLDFGNPETIRVGNLLSGTVSSLNNATILSVFANPSGFYYNLHDTVFPGGAVRDQLSAVPEPGSMALAGTAALGALAWRRRRRTPQRAAG